MLSVAIEGGDPDMSTGGVGGGSYVDENFLKHRSQRIGCLPQFLKANPLMELSIRRWWGETKSTFDGTTTATYLVPVKLHKAWEGYHHQTLDMNASPKSRDEVELTVQQLRSIFDREVNRIVGDIAAALVKKEVVASVKVIMVSRRALTSG